MIIGMSSCHRTGIRRAVRRGASSLAYRAALGQHLLLLLSITVAVRALLVNGWRHRVVALSLGAAGAGYGRGGIGGAALGVKGTVAGAALRSSRVCGIASAAGTAVGVELIWNTKKTRSRPLMMSELSFNSYYQIRCSNKLRSFTLEFYTSVLFRFLNPLEYLFFNKFNQCFWLGLLWLRFI